VDGYDGVVFVDSDVTSCFPTESARPGGPRDVRFSLSAAVVDGDAADTDVIFGPPRNGLGGVPRPGTTSSACRTAYRTSTLARCFRSRRPAGWWTGSATRALLLGARLAFDQVPRMKYRQYPGNVARVLPPFGEEDVLSAAARVESHYAGLLETDWPVPPAKRPRFEAERRRVTSFREAVAGSRPLLEKYVRALAELPARPVWWWCVAHPELEWMWTN
jgi:hypothetical protein